MNRRVRAALEEVRGEAVPEHVRRHLLRDPGADPSTFHDLLHAAGGQVGPDARPGRASGPGHRAAGTRPRNRSAVADSSV